jgi:hypothetical protein
VRAVLESEFGGDPAVSLVPSNTRLHRVNGDKKIMSVFQDICSGIDGLRKEKDLG